MLPDSPALIAQTGPLNGERFSISSEIIIGRDMTCTVVVADRQVSRYHARITIKESGALLEDLGSKNGTYLNGDVISEPIMLQDGDVIQVALVQQFVYLNSDATIPMVGSIPMPVPGGTCERAAGMSIIGSTLTPGVVAGSGSLATAIRSSIPAVTGAVRPARKGGFSSGAYLLDLERGRSNWCLRTGTGCTGAPSA
jgi:pSer/pThr/pTyr-binding forkhead associated (FHA) protein